MIEFDENGLFCREFHRRINFDSWEEAEKHEYREHYGCILMSKEAREYRREYRKFLGKQDEQKNSIER